MKFKEIIEKKSIYYICNCTMVERSYKNITHCPICKTEMMTSSDFQNMKAAQVGINSPRKREDT